MSDLNFQLQLAGQDMVDFAPVIPRQSIRMGDQGIRTIVQVVDGNGMAVNIRAATVRKIKLLKPDGTTYDATGLLLSNGVDGKMYFTSTSLIPPFGQVGEWQIQAKITVGGVTQSTQWANFTVGPNIDSN